MEMEAMEDGFVAKILKPDGAQNVVVGEPVMIVVEDAADVAAFAGYTGGDAPAAAPKAAAAAPKAAPAPPPPRAAAPAAPAAPAAQWSAPAAGSRVVASPLAKKNAAAAGLPLAGLAGTGPGGRVLAADVADALQARAHAPAAATAAAPAAAGPSALDAFFPAYTDASVSNIRKITAQRLQESKQTVPHFYLSVDVSMDALLKARAALNGAPGAAHKISVNDLMIKAAALACARVPDVNASWLGDRIRRYSAVDVSVAVQTDAGLMVPIVRGADTKGLAAISADVKALAAKARAGKLTPAEFVGGTFTISNLGMMGVKSFAAIINPPQAAILAVGATRKQVVSAPGGGYAEASVLTATLSCDHRVVDGAVGAAWLAAFKGLLEDPLTMVL
jgi:pyruvate dehydrogenase E2 component (dihydrolipoamide acetyltransferase)